LYGKKTAQFVESEIGLMRAFAGQVVVAFENVQILARLDAQLESLHRVVQSRNLDEVLDQTLNGVNSILGEGTSSSINLYDDLPGTFGSSRAAGPLTKLLEVPPRPNGTGRYVLKTGKPLYLDDVTQPPPDCPTIRDAETKRNVIRSFAALPLMRQEQVVGVLFVNLQMPTSFSEAIRRILELFTSQAAIAIENARLLNEIAESTRRLARLQKVAAISSVELPDLEKILQVIVQNLTDVIPGASCGIRMYDPSLGKFGIWVATGPLKGWQKAPRAKGTIYYVITTKSALYRGDTTAAPPEGQPSVRKEFAAQGVRAIAVLPLRSKRGVIGALYIDLTSPHSFSENEKQLLELFADQAAVVIENARLYEETTRLLRELEDRIKELEKIGELSEELSADAWLGGVKRGFTQQE